MRLVGAGQPADRAWQAEHLLFEFVHFSPRVPPVDAKLG